MRDFEPDDESIFPQNYTPSDSPKDFDPGIPNQLLDYVLRNTPSKIVDTDLFAVMAKRRSTRKFSDKPVETVKIDKIIAAADTAPTAGNYQGFEIFYLKNIEKKNYFEKSKLQFYFIRQTMKKLFNFDFIF